MKVPFARQAWAFVRRDLQVASSYRLSFVLTTFGGLFTLTVLHFLSKTVGENALLTRRYGTDYFSFALVGVAVAALLRSVGSGLSSKLREAQSDGSLEPLMASPLSTVRLLSMMTLYPVTLAALRVALMFAFGAWLFGATLEVSPGRLLLGLALSLLAFAALGLLSAAVVLVFKRGDPFTFALDTATYLFSGVMYPVEVLPQALQWVSNLLPATHALTVLRAATLGGEATTRFSSGAWALVGLCLLFWPLAAGALVWARRHVERSGTLSHL